MIQPEKVVLMTQLASFEKHEGRRVFKISKYFRSDYISVQLFTSLIAGTIGFALIVGLYVLYDIELLMGEMYNMDYFAFAKKIVMLYLVFIVAYLAFTYLMYTIRYAGNRKELKRYYQNLKKLETMYDK